MYASIKSAFNKSSPLTFSFAHQCSCLARCHSEKEKERASARDEPKPKKEKKRKDEWTVQRNFYTCWVQQVTFNCCQILFLFSFLFYFSFIRLFVRFGFVLSPFVILLLCSLLHFHSLEQCYFIVEVLVIGLIKWKYH